MRVLQWDTDYRSGCGRRPVVVHDLLNNVPLDNMQTRTWQSANHRGETT